MNFSSLILLVIILFERFKTITILNAFRLTANF
jgi:hypothetical protein